MNEKIRGIPWGFWVFTVVALIWNFMGVMNFLMQLNPEVVSKFPEPALAIIKDRPIWATGGFAISVFGGTIGCLLLLMKKSAAFHLFVASLLGTILTMVHTIGIANKTSGFGVPQVSMMIIMPLVVASLLIWYAKWTEKKGWIN
ncbi:hypothetical protein HOF92_08685 [bacterium]|nr:hypothetical protein [bacterium]